MSGGGVSLVTTWIYSHGLNSVNYIPIVQDPLTGEIKQGRTGWPSRVSDVIVPVDRNPSPKAFACVAWSQEGHQSNPPVEIRIYWLDRSGRIHERCFSASGGATAEWYDGFLNGSQFGAAAYSGIAASVNRAGNSTPDKIRVCFQEANTNLIREIVRNSAGSFDPFHLVDADPGRPAGIPGTQIATNGSEEVYYQRPDQWGNTIWYVHGEEGTFPPQDSPYNRGATVSVAGSVAGGDAIVCTVNQRDKCLVNAYDKDAKRWGTAQELVNALGNRQVAVASHPQQKAFSKTIALSQDPNNFANVTLVGFAAPSSWEVLPPPN